MESAAPPAVPAGAANAGLFRILPGFVDAHLHIEAWLRSQLAIPLSGGRLDARALAEALSDGPPHGEWLVLFGLDHTQPLQECLAVGGGAREGPGLGLE